MGYAGSTLNNRYRLDKQIGEGGFAHVFLATDLELGRQVAVKVLDQNWAKHKDLLVRFRNEARAIAVLDHPNILLIYDYGVARGAPYLVMPYVSGGTLSDRMRQGPLTLDEIGFYLYQIGSALDYAHQYGIIHRDVKPSNLLIRSNGQLVLMDFGLAKLLANSSLGEDTGVYGTVAYMAPEQLHGIVSAVSDIYMLGIILYQMLAGKLPYEGNTIQIMVGQMEMKPDSLRIQPTMRSVPAAVVTALDQVVMKVLAKDPAERYQTGLALSHAYYKALEADPKRVARPHGNNKNPGKPDFSGTVIDRQMDLPPLPTHAAKEAEERPTMKSPTAPELALNAPPVVSQKTPQLSQQHIPDVADLEATQIARKSSGRKKVLRKPPQLIVTTEPDTVFKAEFELKGQTIKLGRAADNDVTLPLAIISRYHAVLNRLEGDSEGLSYNIVQLKSINPLYFHGEKVEEKVLEDGDIIEIGKRNFAEYIVKLTYRGPEYGFV